MDKITVMYKLHRLNHHKAELNAGHGVINLEVQLAVIDQLIAEYRAKITSEIDYTASKKRYRVTM